MCLNWFIFPYLINNPQKRITGVDKFVSRPFVRRPLFDYICQNLNTNQYKTTMEISQVISYALLGLLAIVAITFVEKTFVIVQQGTIAVIAQFGRYKRLMRPGLGFRIPIIEQVDSRVSIQNRSAELKFQAITSDQANVHFKAMLLYSVLNQDEETIKNVAYKFVDFESFSTALTRTVEGSVRGYVASKKQQEVL